MRKTRPALSELRRLWAIPKCSRSWPILKPIFLFLPAKHDELQSNRAALSISIAHVRYVRALLSQTPAPYRPVILEKFDYVINNNPGFPTLLRISNALNDSNTLEATKLDYSPSELASFKYALIVFCDVEQAFSRFKMVFFSNRRYNLSIEHLTSVLVVECHMETTLNRHVKL